MSDPVVIPRPGDQLASSVSTVRVVVVRAPAQGSPAIACGGSPLVPAGSAPSAPAGGAEPGTLIGKRYVNADESLELLCTASGAGELTCDGVAMTLKAAKPLPASD
jgi:hypothetical protein